MIVLDTSMLVYAVGAEHPLREPSRRLVEAIAAGGVHATTTVEVIQELVHIRERRQGRASAAKAGRSFAQLLAPLLVTPPEAVEAGLRLFERTESLGAFGAFLAATALAHDARALVSADRAFASIPGLPHVVPGTAEFEQLLAA